MKQQPDKLFQEKLSHYRKPVPAPVWEHLEKQLDKKKNRTIWLRIAASLLLTGVAASLLWPLTQSAERHNIASNHIPAPSAQADPRHDAQDQEAPTENTLTPTASVSETPPQENEPIQKKKKHTAPVRPSPAPHIAEVQQPEIPLTEAHITQQPAADLTPVEAIPEKQDQSLTLVFSAAETRGYLDKKINDEATPADENPSTLKRLLKKAKALKNNQDPFGELREMKNEIFALNRSDKRRGQNK